MKVDDNHMFHGAALIQIAEHPQFTAINGVHLGEKLLRCSFRINDSIGIHLKYAREPRGPFMEYVFNFGKKAKQELKELRETCESVFIAFVCVKDRQICCISQDEFSKWLKKRRNALGKREDVSTFLVRVPSGKSMRVDMNQPGTKGQYLGKTQIVARNRFPKALFE